MEYCYEEKFVLLFRDLSRFLKEIDGRSDARDAQENQTQSMFDWLHLTADTYKIRSEPSEAEIKKQKSTEMAPFTIHPAQTGCFFLINMLEFQRS